MELRVPKCALKGLRLSDVKFNDDKNCGLVAIEEDNHYEWSIDYTDCGTVRSQNDTNRITYSNVLSTKLDYTGSVMPIMPLFEVPLKCEIDSTDDFVFENAWQPDVASFEAQANSLHELEGQMSLYHDEHFKNSL